MRYEHGRARTLSHMQVELGGVGTQAALTPLSVRRTHTSEQLAPDNRRRCSTPVVEQPLAVVDLRRMTDSDEVITRTAQAPTLE